MKRDYLSSLARAARWYLPPDEAAEVLEDYRDIAGDRTDEELERDLGTPRKAVRQIAQPKAYRRWLMVFAVLGASALLPAVTPILCHLFWWNISFNAANVSCLVTVLGVSLSVVWFQRNGRKSGAIRKGVLAAMLIPLVGVVWAWVLALTSLYQLNPMTQFLIAHLDCVPAIHRSLLLSGLVMGILSFLGLVKARLGDRRWRAVYIFGLTGTLMSLSLWAMMTHMTLEFVDGWQTPYLLRYIFITLVGLIGTAVSLC